MIKNVSLTCDVLRKFGFLKFTGTYRVSEGILDGWIGSINVILMPKEIIIRGAEYTNKQRCVRFTGNRLHD